MPTTVTKSEASPEASKIAVAKPPNIGCASVPDTLAALKVNPDTGLTAVEVDMRRKENGYNEVAEKKGHPVIKFFKKFWGTSAWMLEVIMVLSAVTRKYSDLLVVSALLVVNAVVSYMQERRAASVVEALRKRLQVNARVLRQSSWLVIAARELVPGDIVRVRPGDVTPADVKLLTGTVTVDQSALTGESKDVDKVAGNALSSGSVVRRGEGDGVVMLIGAKTYFGRTTDLVQQAHPKLHIDAVMSKVVRWLFLVVGVLLGVVVIMSLMHGTPLLEMVPLMLILFMSAIPLSLPVMFTVSMAVGSKELAKRGVLITRLSATEDAATMDVLCVDKTGTITMNQLAVTDVIPLEPATEADVLFAGALASQAADQDPIDLAFLRAARIATSSTTFPKSRLSPSLLSTRKIGVRKPWSNKMGTASCDERGRANRCRGLRIATAGDRGLKARVSASALKGYRTMAVARGPEKASPHWSAWCRCMIHCGPMPNNSSPSYGFGRSRKDAHRRRIAGGVRDRKEIGLPNIRHMADLKNASAQADNKAVDFSQALMVSRRYFRRTNISW